LHVYTDADRLERHLCELSPADAGAARALCNAIRACAAFDRSSESGDWIGAITRAAAVVPSLVQLVTPTWQEVTALGADRRGTEARARQGLAGGSTPKPFCGLWCTPVARRQEGAHMQDAHAKVPGPG
jgi:hypothetical protein